MKKGLLAFLMLGLFSGPVLAEDFTIGCTGDTSMPRGLKSYKYGIEIHNRDLVFEIRSADLRVIKTIPLAGYKKSYGYSSTYKDYVTYTFINLDDKPLVEMSFLAPADGSIDKGTNLETDGLEAKVFTNASSDVWEEMGYRDNFVIHCVRF